MNNEDDYFSPGCKEQLTSFEDTKKRKSGGFQATPEQTLALEKSPMYHGNVSMAYVKEQLNEVGDSLLRIVEGQPRQGQEICITLMHRADQYVSLPMRSRSTTGGRVVYFINDQSFPDPLVCYTEYVERGLLLSKEGYRAKRAIPRQPWEIKKEDLKLDKKIGEGAFGEVCRGQMRDIDVAIKVMKINAKTKGKIGLMKQEAVFMKVYQHRNIVRFYGALINEAEAFIVMELVKGGGLNDYLKAHPDLDKATRASWCYDVAAALAFLHRRGCMHRDVGARNCLVDVEQNILKLSDFGLSCRGTNMKLSHTEQVAIRWAAPEVIICKLYKSASDVWGFAMVAWEIMNNGREPFDDKSLAEIKQNIKNPNFRPPLDSLHWTPELKTAVQLCWSTTPSSRPNMDLICDKLYAGCKHPLQVTDESKKLMKEARQRDKDKETVKMVPSDQEGKSGELDGGGGRTRRLSKKTSKEEMRLDEASTQRKKLVSTHMATTSTTKKGGKKRRPAINRGPRDENKSGDRSNE